MDIFPIKKHLPRKKTDINATGVEVIAPFILLHFHAVNVNRSATIAEHVL